MKYHLKHEVSGQSIAISFHKENSLVQMNDTSPILIDFNSSEL